jgi:hypothetical protein
VVAGMPYEQLFPHPEKNPYMYETLPAVLNKQSLRFVYDLNQTAGFCKYIVNQ